MRKKDKIISFRCNDVEYEIEGEEDKDWLEKQAEIAEYERIAGINPYIFTED